MPMLFVFRSHALERMVERNIGQEAVEHLAQHGEIIREYPDDMPVLP
jgi:hypothetical protein